MDKKEGRNMKKKKKLQPDPARLETSKIVADKSIRECICNRKAREQEDIVASKRSIVRITGQLGLSNEDRYVLRCAATVNDKPVASEFTELENSEPMQQWEGRRQYRDFNIQTEIQCENKYEIQVPMNKTNAMISKEIQATHFDVSLSLELEKNKNYHTNKNQTNECHCTDMGADKKALSSLVKNSINHISCKDRMIQTYCTNMESFKNLLHLKNEIIQCRCNKKDANISITESDINRLKESQNPLLIISVYPAPKCSDNVLISENSKKDHSRDVQKKIVQPRKTVVRNQSPLPFNGNKNDVKVVRPSRSPPPNKGKSNKINRTNETKVLRSSKTSPSRQASPTNQQMKTITDRNGNKIISNNALNIRSTSRSPQKSHTDTKGTNTDHNIAKKAIVDNYTKNITAFIEKNGVERKNRFLKNDSSRITVNIDSENERYDLLFQRDNVTTDFKVKKTLKEQNRNSAARGNSLTRKILAGSDELRKKSHAVSKNEQSNDYPKVPFSRLQARDSLEVSHRPETKARKRINKKTIHGKISEPVSRK